MAVPKSKKYRQAVKLRRHALNNNNLKKNNWSSTKYHNFFIGNDKLLEFYGFSGLSVAIDYS